MARKRKSKRRTKRRSIPREWWSTFLDTVRSPWFRRGSVLLLAAAALCGAGYALAKLDAGVESGLVVGVDRSTIHFVDIPESVERLGLADLNDVVADLLYVDWLDDRLCQSMAERLAKVGWVAEVYSVRRTPGANFMVSARYRAPVAMIQHDDNYLLVDVDGVRLPGSYLLSPDWKLIEGVGSTPPAPGAAWPGLDVRAGLDLLAVLMPEPFSGQVTGVLVGNAHGRADPSRSHVELATDRPGGRIRWGSAPGFEVAENSVEQKLAILRENYRRTGRIDAQHPVIDISTFPDRFTIPG